MPRQRDAKEATDGKPRQAPRPSDMGVASPSDLGPAAKDIPVLTDDGYRARYVPVDVSPADAERARARVVDALAALAAEADRRRGKDER